MSARFRRSCPSPSMTVALMALFVALGGSSYAAVTLKKNSVRSNHIKNGQVKGPDLTQNSVTSTKVKDASLLARDFKSGQLPGGPVGPRGFPGAKGDPGSPGRDATNLFAYVADVSSTTTAALGYGKGAISVSDPAGNNEYRVVFDRNLRGCVAHVDAGFGDPLSPTNTSVGARASTGITRVEGNEVRVERFVGDPAASTDSSFMISVFC